MEAQRSGGGGKELLLPATRGLWNSLEDFKLQVVPDMGDTLEVGTIGQDATISWNREGLGGDLASDSGGWKSRE